MVPSGALLRKFKGFGNRTEIEKRHLHFFGNIVSTVRDVPTALGTPWIYPWGAVRNNGYSDWATTVIDASIKSMWYRFSRREDDYCIESSIDGINYSQMRIFHMWKGNGTIQFGIYACSPENSSFKAIFTNMEITDCKWLAHDGQSSDRNV